MSVLVALLFSVKFAFLTDIHISEGSSRADDLSFCIERINADTTLNFTVFGSWGNALYSLDTKTGALMWKWTCSGSRMFSPAAVNPVKSNGCIFFVTPRRKTYCLDASSGKQLWEADGGRESIALSPEGDCIYVKNMFHKLHCFDAAPVLRQRWCVEDALGYDIAPTSCSVAHGCVYVPTDKGLVGCMDASDGSLLWQHKLSYGLINSIAPLGDGRLLVCTMDGVVTLIKAVP